MLDIVRIPQNDLRRLLRGLRMTDYTNLLLVKIKTLSPKTYLVVNLPCKAVCSIGLLSIYLLHLQTSSVIIWNGRAQSDIWNVHGKLLNTNAQLGKNAPAIVTKSFQNLCRCYALKELSRVLRINLYFQDAYAME